MSQIFLTIPEDFTVEIPASPRVSGEVGAGVDDQALDADVTLLDVNSDTSVDTISADVSVPVVDAGVEEGRA